MTITDVDLTKLSSLTYRIRVCELEGRWYPSALISEFSGRYRWGSEGNGDATFIGAIKAAASSFLRADAVVFDFREMSYEWGNGIWNVLRTWTGASVRNCRR